MDFSISGQQHLRFVCSKFCILVRVKTDLKISQKFIILPSFLQATRLSHLKSKAALTVIDAKIITACLSHT